MSVRFHQFIAFYALLFSLCQLPNYCFAEEPTPSESHLSGSPIPESLKTLESEVERWTLPNGMRVLFVPRRTAPVFAGQIWVRVGGVDEEPGITGIAHFLEHMAFKGTKVIGTKDYSKEKPLLDELEKIVTTADNQAEALRSVQVRDLYSELSELWIDNEFGRLYTNSGANGLNAMTAKDYTAYVVRLPSVAFEMWCWMESDRLLNPVFRQFYKEREVVQEERRRGYDDDPSGKMYEQLISLSFQKHPQGLPVIGYPADLKKLTATEMRKFYDDNYRSDLMVLVLVGDLDSKVVHEQVDRYFSRFPKAEAPLQKDPTPEPPQSEERKMVLELDAQPQVLIGYHKPTSPDPADAQFSVLHSLLSEGRSSILPQILVEDKKVALSVDTGEAPGERYPNLFLVGGTPAPGVSADVLVNAIQDILDQYAASPPSEVSVREAKKRSRVSFLKLLDSDSGLASALGKSEALHGDWRDILKLYADIEATTPEDVQSLAKRFLRPSNRTIVEIKPSAKAMAVSRRSGVSK